MGTDMPGLMLISLGLCSARPPLLRRPDLRRIHTNTGHQIRKVGGNLSPEIENLVFRNFVTGMRRRTSKKSQMYPRKKSANILSEMLAKKLNWRKSGSVTTSL